METAREVETGEGDGRGRGDGDGGGSRVREKHLRGETFVFGAARNRANTEASLNKEYVKVVRRPISLSYKEKLLAPGENVCDDDMGEVTNGMYPVLSVTSEQYTTWCKPWMNSLIIKVLGLSISKHVLIDRVWRMWKPQQPLKVIPLSNYYYIVSFSSKEDHDYAYHEGPWMIDDHYLLVQRWRPNFNPRKADCQRKVAVWVRIPDLPMEFCTVESLCLIGNMIGKIIKIDRSTSVYDKGEFARICVEVDLQKPLLLAFTAFREDKQLVYEGLHLVCFDCGLYGHVQEQCSNRSKVEEIHVSQQCVGV
ncbi:hypothetical protein K1719_008324 [Acacia pycnantha]|nr:hypothetical protein K1719_008324 [Acacia pycnantha]